MLLLPHARPTPLLYAFWDGNSYPNPGKMGLGAIVIDRQDHVLAKRWRNAGNGGNNLAEYYAAMMAVELLEDLFFLKHFRAPYELRGDSLLVVKQVKGFWSPTGTLKPACRKLQHLLKENSISWTPRRDNRTADSLATEALAMPEAQNYTEYSQDLERSIARVLLAHVA